MKKQTPPAIHSCPKASAENDTINTQQLRAMLAKIADALADISIEDAPDRATKLTIQMINLTKTIRETESYNRKLLAPFDDSRANGKGALTLERWLDGYAPTPAEVEEFEAELKECLKIIGPRLFEDEPK